MEYEVELTGTFVKEIHSRVSGPPGLSRKEIEGLIEADWAMIAADKSILLESSWTLESVRSVSGGRLEAERDVGHIGEYELSSNLVHVGRDRSTAWILLVTQGTVHAYPPELYVDRGRAAQEAERWAWILSGAGVARIERPFENRWEVADFDVRMVPVEAGVDLADPWIGTYWNEDGTPDPEAVVFSDRTQALTWALEPPYGGSGPAWTDQSEWFVAATFLRHGEETYAVAHHAKRVT